MDDLLVEHLGKNAAAWREKIKARQPKSGAIIKPAEISLDDILKPMPEDEELLRLRLRDSGWRIYDEAGGRRGGFQALQEVYDAVYDKYGAGVARRLDNAWEGIGGWAP